ncbi:hypothetical protein BHM03_00020410 [Ensete ventricosum]|nr:hypothetical protein BHM03_00020410 [Ensete ventricosum]
MTRESPRPHARGDRAYPNPYARDPTSDHDSRIPEVGRRGPPTHSHSIGSHPRCAPMAPARNRRRSAGVLGSFPAQRCYVERVLRGIIFGKSLLGSQNLGLHMLLKDLGILSNKRQSLL